MFARVLVAILLLSSHTLSLRAAIMPHPGDASSISAADSCCPLCVPASDGAEPMGCGCGCGEAERDDRLPTSPDDTPAVIGGERGLPESNDVLGRVVIGAGDAPLRMVSVFDDAHGHSNTNRFLAWVGVWLN